MRILKALVVLTICVFGLSLLANASHNHNEFGVADHQRITFDNPVRVGDVLLPSGDYRVTHTMEGNDHVMVFRQLNTKKPAEAKVKCHLVPLKEKAERTRKIFEYNAAKEEVLRTLVFQGDMAQHEF